MGFTHPTIGYDKHMRIQCLEKHDPV
ncbi:hypothetical protein MNBD_ALPHA07-543 [hydrothermal vent metagenome]|uniref:Uncharacterized protein n=1 Tax=hydrothermal vent metagenome TaxID=652676 RepID=A0A3B0S032_9ZZZZ